MPAPACGGSDGVAKRESAEPALSEAEWAKSRLAVDCLLS